MRIARTLPLRLLLAAALVALPALVPARAQDGGQQTLTAAERGEVRRVETYLNNIDTMRARFVQIGAQGGTSQGWLYIDRPGKLRFEYDPPASITIVADGAQVTYHDPNTGDFSQVPLGWTLARILVGEQIELSGDISVIGVEQTAGRLTLTLIQTDDPQSGRVIITFADKPLQLRRWTVIDEQGRSVNMALDKVEFGVELNPALFQAPQGPDDDSASKIGR
jgi:outer membrane lipoprotein-sorting protein